MAGAQVRQRAPLRALVLAAKGHLRAAGLGDASTGGLSSFSLALMAIAHLQAAAQVRCP